MTTRRSPWKKFRLPAGAVLAVLAAFWLSRLAHHRPAGDGSAGWDAGASPLGGWAERMSHSARLKARMGQLRAVWPALKQFSEGHQGRLPGSLAELRPYLPPALSELPAQPWSMPLAGRAAGPLLTNAAAVLLEQTGVPRGAPRIIVYGDGHIEYKQAPD